ncbi:MAG: hypothetical protein P8M80_07960 [Pirellulaceae bacterium]|nr:hypothetical protein [Pirellulaceae bacterium]
MNSTTFADVALLAQQGGGDYGAGQIAGVIFLIVLGGAILWKFVKK